MTKGQWAPCSALCQKQAGTKKKSGFESCFSIVQTGPFTSLGGGPGKEDIWEPLLAGEKNTHTVNMYKRLGNLVAQDPVENFYSLLLLLLLSETFPPTHPSVLLPGDMSWSKAKSIHCPLPIMKDGAGWGEGGSPLSEQFSTISKKWGFLQSSAKQICLIQIVTSEKEIQAPWFRKLCRAV